VYEASSTGSCAGEDITSGFTMDSRIADVLRFTESGSRRHKDGVQPKRLRGIAYFVEHCADAPEEYSEEAQD